MTQPPSKTIWREGLWDNNPGLVQLLGLCPLLAVTTTATNGLSLGVATVLVLVITNAMVSLLRHHIARDIRIPLFVLIIASAVTVVELLLQAYFFELSTTLGIFIPLIVTNCTILARAEAFASKQALWPAIQDGLAQGIGFLGVLVTLGALRELVGSGTVFAGIEHLVSPHLRPLSLNLWSDHAGFLLALLPPGAFIGLGLMLAARQWWMGRAKRHAQHATEVADVQAHDQSPA